MPKNNQENFIKRRISKSNSQKVNSSILGLNWIKKLRRTSKQHEHHDQPISIKNESNAEEIIEKAKIHRLANRPLKKIAEFDGSTKFCQCCYNAMKDDVHLTDFQFCDSNDEYAQFGLGISLYFFYILYSIIILLFAFCNISWVIINYNKKFSDEIFHFCNNIYLKKGNNTNNYTFPLCNGFIDINENSILNNNNQIILLLKFNSMNIKQYRDIFMNITNGNDKINKVIIDYNFLNFIALISLLIIHSLFTINLFNINKQYDMSVTSPSDYAVLITNLHSAFDIFYNQINGLNEIIRKAENKQENLQNSLIIQDKNEDSYRIILGQFKELGLDNFDQKKEIDALNGFIEFLKNIICDNENGKKNNIYLVNICYKIIRYLHLQKNIEKNNNELYIAKNDPEQILKNINLKLSEEEKRYFYYPLDIFDLYVCPFTLWEKSKKITDIEKEKNKFEEEQKNLLKKTENLTRDNFSGAIFIIFNSMKEKDKFLENHKKNIIISIIKSIYNLKYYICFCCINSSKRKQYFLKNKMIIEQAPEPEDIIYENLEFSQIERLFRILLVYIISFIIIAICFFFILYLNKFQIESDKEKNSIVKKYGISLSISLIITIINSVFQKLLLFFTKLEKQICMTNYYLSYSIKLTILTFLSSTIIPYLSSNYYEEHLNHDILITNCFTMFLSNSFIVPITWIFNLDFFIKKLRIYIINKKKKRLPQKELNNLYELLDMNIASKYSYITRTLLMGFFYLPIFPLGIPICFLGFIFVYILEKYSFIKMYKKPIMLNSRIYEVYSNYYVINFFMLSLSNYIFLKDVLNSKFWCLFNIILLSALLIFPYNHLLSIDFIKINEGDLKNKELYEDSFYNFFNDYERNNPITKKDGIKHFLDKLLEKVLISQKDYDTILQNYEKMNLLEIYYKSKLNLGNILLKRALSINFSKDNEEDKDEEKESSKKDMKVKNNISKINFKESENTNVKEERTKASDVLIYRRNRTEKFSSNNCININNNLSNNKIIDIKKFQIKNNNKKLPKKLVLRKDLIKSNKSIKRKLISIKNTIENE